MKLADLNGIQLHIQPGWYPLTLELIKELGTLGWNRKVSCIKQKYATLRFYADYRDYKLFEKYERLSEEICETCGERGEVRYDTSWMYVACRKHYMEDHSCVTFASNTGFIYNDISYNWEDIVYVYFKNKDGEGNYNTIDIVFNKVIRDNGGTLGHRLYVSRKAFGLGHFMRYLPENIPGVDYGFTGKFKQVAFCEICGYEAVYNGYCECCENETYGHLSEGLKNTYESRVGYIAFKQMGWALDEGDFYASEMGIYKKTKYYKILYTEEQFDAYKNAGDE